MNKLDKSSDFDREDSYNDGETLRRKSLHPRTNFTASPFRMDQNLIEQKNSKSDEMLKNQEKNEKAEKL